MNIGYVEDINGWEKWRQKYRYGVLLIFPPEPVMSQVNELRRKYDPQSANGCDAHISLTVPLPRPLAQADYDEIGNIVSDIRSFTIRFGPLRHYLPHPGVCLAIEQQEQLDVLRMKLESARLFEEAKKRRYPYSAHMTIAEFITVDQTNMLMEQLGDSVPQDSFICDGVSYAVPDERFRFTERVKFKLA